MSDIGGVMRLDQGASDQRPGPGPRGARVVPTVVLVGADRGGVGKTTVARLVLEFLGAHAVVPRIVDTQPGEGILRRYYPAAELIDVARVSGQMAVLDSPKPLTVVDIRAGLLLPALTSLRDNGLLADARTGAVRFYVLHLVGSDHASFAEVAPTHELLDGAGAGAQHILVRNRVSADATYDWESPLPIVDVAHLDDLAVAATDEEGCAYEKFTKDPRRSRVLRGAVRHWLDAAYPALARVGLAAVAEAAVKGE